MTHRRRGDPRLAFAALLWLVCGALVPTGYMPAFAGGRVTVEPCPGMAALHHGATNLPHKGTSHSHSDGGGMCAYAGIGPAFSAGEAVFFAAPAMPPSPAAMPALAAGPPRRGVLNPNAPPQAPPPPSA